MRNPPPPPAWTAEDVGPYGKTSGDFVGEAKFACKYSSRQNSAYDRIPQTLIRPPLRAGG